MDVECWAVIRYVLDAVAYVVTSYKEGSLKELEYFIDKVLPSVLNPNLARDVAELVTNELREGVQVIDVVLKVQQLLLDRLRCDEVVAS